MTCQNCVRHVKEAISEVSGVKSVDVSLENASAKVSSDSDLDRGALKTAVQEAGYAILDQLVTRRFVCELIVRAAEPHDRLKIERFQSSIIRLR